MDVDDIIPCTPIETNMDAENRVEDAIRHVIKALRKRRAGKKEASGSYRSSHPPKQPSRDVEDAHISTSLESDPRLYNKYFIDSFPPFIVHIELTPISTPTSTSLPKSNITPSLSLSNTFFT